MKLLSDKILLYAGYLYLSLPFLIFAIGWLRWYYAIIITTSVLLSLFLIFKNQNEYKQINFKKHRNKILITVAIVFFIVFFSGIGGFSYQDEDFQYRNAMLRDLITYKWPVVYKMSIPDINHPLFGKYCLYVYYIAHWMPAAVVGKLLGWQAANYFLFLWSAFGILLIYYFICRLFDRFSLKLLFIFLIFDGLYILISFIKFPFINVIKSDYQLWVNDLIPPGSPLIMIYWFFNQCIGTWLVIILLLNNLRQQNIIFLYAMCLFFSPFSFVGLFPYIIYFFIKIIFFNSSSKNVYNNLSRSFSFQNITAIFCIILPLYLYYSSSASSHFSILHFNIKKYLLYALVTFGIISIIIFKKYRYEPLYYIAIITFIIFPFIGVGYIPWFFGSRATIPSFFILSILVSKFLLEESRKSIIIAVNIYLLLCSFNSILEISKSIYYTVNNYFNKDYISHYLYNHNEEWSYQKTIGRNPDEDKNKNFLIQDDLKTLSNPKDGAITNYAGNIDKSFFYKYLAKHNLK